MKMQKILKKFSLLFLASFLLSSCGGGGGNTFPPGVVCDPDYNPIKVELNPTGKPTLPLKVSLNPDDGEISLFPGTYVYQGADIFYYDRSLNLKLHVKEGLASEEQKRKSKEQFSKGRVCVSGFKLNTKINFIMTSVSQFTVDEAGKFTLVVRSYPVGYENNRLNLPFAEGDGSSFEAPSKVYEGVAQDFAFYKMARNNEKNFELRAQYTDGNISKYIRVRFKRDPTIKPTEAKPVESPIAE